MTEPLDRENARMSDLAPVSASQPVRLTEPTLFARVSDDIRPVVRRGEDKVEVSDVAHYLAKLRDLPVREDLVGQAREAIARDQLDTADRLDAALDELLEDL